MYFLYLGSLHCAGDSLPGAWLLPWQPRKLQSRAGTRAMTVMFQSAPDSMMQLCSASKVQIEHGRQHQIRSLAIHDLFRTFGVCFWWFASAVLYKACTWLRWAIQLLLTVVTIHTRFASQGNCHSPSAQSFCSRG